MSKSIDISLIDRRIEYHQSSKVNAVRIGIALTLIMIVGILVHQSIEAYQKIVLLGTLAAGGGALAAGAVYHYHKEQSLVCIMKKDLLLIPPLLPFASANENYTSKTTSQDLNLNAQDPLMQELLGWASDLEELDRMVDHWQVNPQMAEPHYLRLLFATKQFKTEREVKLFYNDVVPYMQEKMGGSLREVRDVLLQKQISTLSINLEQIIKDNRYLGVSEFLLSTQKEQPYYVQVIQHGTLQHVELFLADYKKRDLPMRPNLLPAALRRGDASTLNEVLRTNPKGLKKSIQDLSPVLWVIQNASIGLLQVLIEHAGVILPGEKARVREGARRFADKRIISHFSCLEGDARISYINSLDTPEGWEAIKSAMPLNFYAYRFCSLACVKEIAGDIPVAPYEGHSTFYWAVQRQDRELIVHHLKNEKLRKNLTPKEVQEILIMTSDPQFPEDLQSALHVLLG